MPALSRTLYLFQVIDFKEIKFISRAERDACSFDLPTIALRGIRKTERQAGHG
jgi:hypothetical protein